MFSEMDLSKKTTENICSQLGHNCGCSSGTPCGSCEDMDFRSWKGKVLYLCPPRTCVALLCWLKDSTEVRESTQHISATRVSFKQHMGSPHCWKLTVGRQSLEGLFYILVQLPGLLGARFACIQIIHGVTQSENGHRDAFQQRTSL